jgi:hypothetical protein
MRRTRKGARANPQRISRKGGPRPQALPSLRVTVVPSTAPLPDHEREGRLRRLARTLEGIRLRVASGSAEATEAGAVESEEQPK